MANRVRAVSRNWSRAIASAPAPQCVFGVVMLIIVLVSGCGNSGSDPESAAGGSGGHGGVQGAGGTSGGGASGSGSLSGTGGATANAGSSGGGSSGGIDNHGNGGTSSGGSMGGSGGALGAGGAGGNVNVTGAATGAGGKDPGPTSGPDGSTVTSGSGGNSSGQDASPGGSSGGREGTGGVGSGGSGGSSGVGSGGISGNTGTGGMDGGGSGGSGGAGGVGGTNIGDAGGAGGAGGNSNASLTALGNAFCAAARTCCAKSTYTTTLGDCETKFQSRLFGLAYVNRGVETIDNTALAACIAGYKEAATTCAFNPLETACKDVFVGTKAEGAACGIGGVPMSNGSGECKKIGDAVECVWTGDVNVATATGTCHTPPHGKNGELCASTCEHGDDCVFDLLTTPEWSTGVCFEDDSLYCKSSGTPGISMCAPIVPTGGSCADDLFACGSRSYCDSTSGTAKCTVSLTLGQTCSTYGTRCLSSLMCGTNNKCDDLGFAYDTTCSGTPPFP
jgi:hypothetical protein